MQHCNFTPFVGFIIMASWLIIIASRHQPRGILRQVQDHLIQDVVPCLNTQASTEV